MLYHGSKALFSSFSLDFMQTTSEGYGIYFGDIELASQYAEPYLYACEIEGKPLAKRKFKDDFIVKLIKTLPHEVQTLLIENYGHEVLTPFAIDFIAEDLHKYNSNNINILCCLINSLGSGVSYVKAVYKALYQLTGVTHVRVTTDRGVNMVVVFQPEKIKIVEVKTLERV